MIGSLSVRSSSIFNAIDVENQLDATAEELLKNPSSLAVFCNPYVLNCGHIEDADTITKTEYAWAKRCIECKGIITSATYVPIVTALCDRLQSEKKLLKIQKERPAIKKKMLSLYPQENLMSKRVFGCSSLFSLAMIISLVALTSFALQGFLKQDPLKENLFFSKKRGELSNRNVSALNVSDLSSKESSLVGDQKAWTFFRAAKKTIKEEPSELDQKELSKAIKRLSTEDFDPLLKLVKRGVGVKEAIETIISLGAFPVSKIRKLVREVFNQGEGYSVIIDLAARGLASDEFRARRAGLYLFDELFLFGRDHLDVAAAVIDAIESFGKPIPCDLFQGLQKGLSGEKVSPLLQETALRWIESDNWRVQLQALSIGSNLLKESQSKKVLETIEGLLKKELKHPLVQKDVEALRSKLELAKSQSNEPS